MLNRYREWTLKASVLRLQPPKALLCVEVRTERRGASWAWASLWDCLASSKGAACHDLTPHTYLLFGLCCRSGSSPLPFTPTLPPSFDREPQHSPVSYRLFFYGWAPRLRGDWQLPWGPKVREWRPPGIVPSTLSSSQSFILSAPRDREDMQQVTALHF